MSSEPSQELSLVDSTNNDSLRNGRPGLRQRRPTGNNKPTTSTKKKQRKGSFDISAAATGVDKKMSSKDLEQMMAKKEAFLATTRKGPKDDWFNTATPDQMRLVFTDSTGAHCVNPDGKMPMTQTQLQSFSRVNKLGQKCINRHNCTHKPKECQAANVLDWALGNPYNPFCPRSGTERATRFQEYYQNGHLGGVAGTHFAAASETNTAFYNLVGNGDITNNDGVIVATVIPNQCIPGKEDKQAILLIGQSEPTDEEGNSLDSSSEVILKKIKLWDQYEDSDFSNATTFLDNNIQWRFGLDPMPGNIDGRVTHRLLPSWTHYQRMYTHKNLTTNVGKLQSYVEGYTSNKNYRKELRK